MHRTLAKTIAAAGLLAVLPLGAAGADDACYDVDPDPVDVVLACEDERFLTNRAATRVTNGTPAGLGEAKPTTGDRYTAVSVNAVPGATFVNNTDTRFQHTVEGTFTGVLDAVDVEAYVGDPVAGALGAAVTYRVRLLVDGRTVFDNYAGTATAIETQHVEENFAIASFKFVDLYELLDDLGIDNDDDTEHTVRLQFTDFYYGDGNNVLYFGSAEAPSSVTFNPLKPNKFATTLR